MMMYDMMSGPWAIAHLVVFAAFAALVLYPTGRILQRLGFSPFWSVVAVIPLANLIGLWVIATIPWPREGYGPQTGPVANPAR